MRLYVILGALFASILCGCGKPAVPKKNVSSVSSRSQETDSKESRSVRHTSARPVAGGRNLSPSEIFERYSSAVFKIHTSNGYQGSQGSGFFISSQGIAVSNYHVFQGTFIGFEEIILSNGESYKVDKVYAKSAQNDFIIFKVHLDRRVNFVPIASSIPKIGEKVYTIGSPHGLDNTFSSGEVSQIRENGRVIQISAPIDHGSSGGVLLNSQGEAIGITSAGYDDSGANLNFAISIDVLKPYIRNLR